MAFTTSLGWYCTEATPEDRPWVLELYKLDEQYDSSLGWWRYWRRGHPDFHARGTAEKFWVVQPKIGFVHWRTRADGTRVVDGLAVAPAHRFKGHGRHMLELVGRPLEIKVLTTAAPARSFCLAVGLQPLAKIPSARGGRQFILFRGD